MVFLPKQNSKCIVTLRKLIQRYQIEIAINESLTFPFLQPTTYNLNNFHILEFILYIELYNYLRYSKILFLLIFPLKIVINFLDLNINWTHAKVKWTLICRYINTISKINRRLLNRRLKYQIYNPLSCKKSVASLLFKRPSVLTILWWQENKPEEHSKIKNLL